MNFEFMTIDTPLPPCMPFPITQIPSMSDGAVIMKSAMVRKC